ncbi:uncharacterized protein LOC135482462 [Lineus longissimus]|uniref:uncharacterized protein LOC135482462 n=1 Tax=Lineus longissimus TaxID=88925 RepID=UPI00315C6597
MQLSVVRLGKAPVWAKVKRIPGLLYAGKYQLYKPVTNRMKVEAVEAIVREKRNLDLLSRPYLTNVQETVAQVHVAKREANREAIMTARELKHMGDRNLKMTDFFEFNKRTKAWE